MKLKIGRKLYTIDSYADASALWASHRPSFPGGRMPRVHVIENDGTLRYVSWNGKVWPRADARNWQTGDQPVYAP